jgi:hypothetical protein
MDDLIRAQLGRSVQAVSCLFTSRVCLVYGACVHQLQILFLFLGGSLYSCLRRPCGEPLGPDQIQALQTPVIQW